MLMLVSTRVRSSHASAGRIDRLQRVAGDVQQRLDDLVAIELRVRQAGIVVAFDDNAGLRFAAQQMEHVLAQLVDIDGDPSSAGATGPSMRSTSARRRSASLMMTAVYSLSEPSCSSRSSSCAAPRSPPSGFLISCRELAHHEPAAIEAREHLALARDALARARIGQFDQQVRAGHLSLERRHGDVDHHRLAMCLRGAAISAISCPA